jgi:hypothetical protein
LEKPQEEVVAHRWQSSLHVNHMRQSEANRRMKHQHLNQLRSIIEAGKNAQGFMIHNRPEGDPVITRRAAGTAGVLDLRDVKLISGATALNGMQPNEVTPGELISLPASLVKGSRVARAGATVVVVPEPSRAVPLGNTGEIALVATPHRYITVEAAPFALVPEPAAPALPDLPESAAPISRADVSFAGPSYGVRFSISRRDMTMYQMDAILEQLLQAINLGLARAADHALLTALVASPPAPFTLGAAAAAGVEFAELRALVGTNADAAAVGQDGTLRAAGVLAEFTPAISSTVVGAFTRAAVAVHDGLRVAVERRNAAGDMVVTCWADLQALLPNPAFFWTAA